MNGMRTFRRMKELQCKEKQSCRPTYHERHNLGARKQRKSSKATSPDKHTSGTITTKKLITLL